MGKLLLIKKKEQYNHLVKKVLNCNHFNILSSQNKLWNNVWNNFSSKLGGNPKLSEISAFDDPEEVYMTTRKIESLIGVLNIRLVDKLIDKV